LLPVTKFVMCKDVHKMVLFSTTNVLIKKKKTNYESTFTCLHFYICCTRRSSLSENLCFYSTSFYSSTDLLPFYLQVSHRVLIKLQSLKKTKLGCSLHTFNCDFFDSTQMCVHTHLCTKWSDMTIRVERPHPSLVIQQTGITTRTILSVKMNRENSHTLLCPEWGSNPIPSDPQ
jgi:hypothetical protein